MAKMGPTPLFKSLLFLSTLLFVLSVVPAIPTQAAITKPSVSSLSVSTTKLDSTGGSVVVSVVVHNASACTFFVRPAVAGDTKRVACTSGRIRDRLTFPSDTSGRARMYRIHVVVKGRGGEVAPPPKSVSVAATTGPIIMSLKASSSGLTNAGGNISITATLAHEVSCSFNVTPALPGFGGEVPCASGVATAYVTLPANTTSAQINYVFTLTVNGGLHTTSTTVTVTVSSTSTVPTTTTTTPPPVRTGNTVSVPAGPDAFVQTGSDIWVASCEGNAVTEINKYTKQIIRILTNTSNPSYGFSCPRALAFDGTHIWVANEAGNSLTQLNESTGAWVQTITASNIAAPVSLAFDGTHIWVGNSSGTVNGPAFSLVAFNATTGDRFDAVKDNFLQYPLNPTCIAFTGTDLWVSDSGGQSAFEYSLSGRYLRTTSLGDVSGVNCVAYHSGYIWISSGNTSKVLEYNASSGAFVREIIEPEGPSQLIFTGSYLFVSNTSPAGNLVLEYHGNVLKKQLAKPNATPNGNAMLYDGSNLWVANLVTNRVTAYKT